MNNVITMDPNRVGVSDAARKLIEQLKQEYGPIMFHLSGGCCDGSAPMCFQVGEFKLGGVDEKVGEIAGCEFWMDRHHFGSGPHPLDRGRRPGPRCEFLARSPAQQAVLDPLLDVRGTAGSLRPG